MFKVLKFLTNFTILVFLAVVLTVYAFMPQPAGILFDEEGKTIYSVPRDTFFYFSLFAFIAIQLIVFFFIKNLEKKAEGDVMQRFLIWSQGFNLAINLFFILFLVFIGLANNAVDYSFSSIQFILYAAPLVVILWVMLLPVWLYVKRGKS